MLADKWGAAILIIDVLQRLHSFLKTPYERCSLNYEAHELYKEDRNLYDKTARDWTKKYAME